MMPGFLARIYHKAPNGLLQYKILPHIMPHMSELVPHMSELEASHE